MRYLLISDVHGNLPALEAVLRDAASRGELAGRYHLGDLVGYAPWGDEVVATIAREGIAGIAGNYDSTTAMAHDHCGCRYEDPAQETLAHASFAWTVSHTSAETKRWLGALPFRLDVRPFGGHVAGPTLRLVHGNHSLNTVYTTAERSDDTLAKMADAMGARAGDVVCFGHTHRGWHREVGGIHFVNTGSVGRPKDGDSRAGYVLLDFSATGVTVEHVRVAYDVEATARAIVASELPDALADYLRAGGETAAQPR